MSQADPQGTLELHAIVTGVLPDALEYAVLRPRSTAGPLPLLLLLHGGNGSRDMLEQFRPTIEAAWASGRFPHAVVVTPSCGRSFYMNTRDGSARWEDALIGPLLDAARSQHGASPHRDATAIAGISMGGMGALRIAFKHPHLFCAVAAMEPGIEPALRFAEIALEDRFYRDDALFQRIFGEPVDEDYWAVNNPASVVGADPGRIRNANLAIALECGDEDSFGLFRGAEFLHRLLYDNNIRHDYHLVRGADHLGRTVLPRFEAVLSFVARAFDPPPPDESLAGLHQAIANWKRQAGLTNDGPQA